ncbi:MAG: GntR family transcriptional regulator [Lachnospiraceae bacterium]|nr:GntR family transcriptional regulator [Lachnospiraceae bacterium]MCD8123495.1 GntR family transcriptional regulator [Lachnospiraceae bacterium]
MEELAYQRIKENILNLTYRPGSTLSESALAEELNMSRLPVRVALKQLVAEGLVQNDYYKKNRVKPVTRRDVVEIYQLRDFLETEAFRRIFAENRQEEYSYRLEEKIVRMCAKRHDNVAWEEADTKMHQEIVTIYDNHRIEKIYQDNLCELIRIGLLSEKGYDHIAHTNERLKQMVELMRQNEYNAAYAILKEDHLILGRELALKKITE